MGICASLTSMSLGRVSMIIGRLKSLLIAKRDSSLRFSFVINTMEKELLLRNEHYGEGASPL